MELWEILINTACITAVGGYILVLVYRAGRRVGSYEVSAEVSSHYQGLVNEIVRRGYAEVYPYNDPDDMPSELWEIEWKEGAAQDDAEAVEIIRNKRHGQWLALPNGAIINMETGDKE